MSRLQFRQYGDIKRLNKDLRAENPSDEETALFLSRYRQAVQVLGASCTRIQVYQSPGEAPGRELLAETFIWPPQEGLKLHSAKGGTPGAKVQKAEYDKSKAQATVMVTFENMYPRYSSVQTIVYHGNKLPEDLRIEVDNVTNK